VSIRVGPLRHYLRVAADDPSWLLVLARIWYAVCRSMSDASPAQFPRHDARGRLWAVAYPG
jgi:hypothetical protein